MSMLARGVRRQASYSVRAMSSNAAADPAFTRTYGGLKDQDRIFTNLYGEGVSLASAFQAASWCGELILPPGGSVFVSERICARRSNLLLYILLLFVTSLV